MSSVHVHGHTGLAPTSEPFGSHARRSSPSLCAGALAAPNPPRIGSAPPRALTVTRPAGGAALRARGAPRAPAGPYLSGGLCRGAAPVHGARRPASEARSPPRRGDSGRFEFTTARPVPNLPPPGSQRHVTTGAAEGVRSNCEPTGWRKNYTAA
nr:protein transport protein SEC31-like isoform X2 [Microcebus murinus]